MDYYFIFGLIIVVGGTILSLTNARNVSVGMAFVPRTIYGRTSQ